MSRCYHGCWPAKLSLVNGDVVCSQQNLAYTNIDSKGEVQVPKSKCLPSFRCCGYPVQPPPTTRHPVNHPVNLASPVCHEVPRFRQLYPDSTGWPGRPLCVCSTGCIDQTSSYCTRSLDTYCAESHLNVGGLTSKLVLCLVYQLGWIWPSTDLTAADVLVVSWECLQAALLSKVSYYFGRNFL